MSPAPDAPAARTSVRILSPRRRGRLWRACSAPPSLPQLSPRRARACLLDERGAATAEYAIATMAAVAFAGMLVAIMRSDEVRGILADLVRRALSVQ